MGRVHAVPVRRVRFSCVAISLLTFLVLPVAAFAQAGNFSAGVNYPVPDNPNPLALGAFTSSGTLDVAVATEDSNVSILIGNGDGTFQPEYTVQAVPTTGPYAGYVTQGVAIGDFNGDGNLDIAVLCLDLSTSAGTINVLLGDGTGHFGAPTVIPLDGTDPVQVLAGNFDSNSNSNVDLAVLNRLSESVTILLGNGDGTFNALPDTSIGLDGVFAMAAADFNKDGKLDLAVTNAEGVAVLLGNGDGTFQPLVNWALPTIQGETNPAEALAVGDFNNDGNPDIAVGAPNSDVVYIFLGQGDGSFQSPPISSPVTFPGGSFATADFNSDGNLDLASPTNNSEYDLELYLGNGAGSISANAVAVAGIASSNASVNVITLISADVNGDGYPDLIMTTGSSPQGAVTVMLNCGLRCTNTGVTSPTRSVFNQPITFSATVTPANVKATGTPTGTVVFQATAGNPPVTTTMGNATLSNGTATLTYSSLPDDALYTISANYQGDSNFNSSTSNAQPPPLVQLLVQSAPTTVVIASSTDPSTPGEAVTFTATVTSQYPGSVGPTGTVTFSSNGNALVSQPLNSSGVATFTTSALATGTDSITAAYSGDSNFAASTSSAMSQIVGTGTAPFAVSASPTSATVSAGASAMFTVTLATTPSAKTAIALSCSGLPMGASCSFSPAQITPKGASATTTLTISTTGSGSVFEVFPAAPRWPGPALPFAFLGLLALAMVALARKQQTQKSAVPALVLLCMFVMLAGAIGCGGNSSAPAQTVTPNGTSQITVMASANGQSQTATVSLTVN